MKEIAIISGKGGTGKSCISAAFASLTTNNVLADCDVDAANLHLIFKPEVGEEHVFVSGNKATINYELCVNCGLCIEHCNFGAITLKEGKTVISSTLCDGCKLCARLCPSEAIIMIPEDRSRLYAGKYRYGTMVHGRLYPGEENSGKLVDRVRQKAKEKALESHAEYIILDGPPGIGCPVISTITGVDSVVIVTEPSISGIHDLQRTIALLKEKDVSIFIIINKYDLNMPLANRISVFAEIENIPVLAKIPFDPEIVQAMISCKSIVEYAPESMVSYLLREAFNFIK